MSFTRIQGGGGGGRKYVYPKDDGRVIPKNAALNKRRVVGITHRGSPTRKMPKQSPTHRNRRKWWDGYEECLQSMVDYVKRTHYDGDSVRMATKSGMFTKDMMHSIERFVKKKWPDVMEEYEQAFNRKLTGHLLVRRISFLYDRYIVKKNGGTTKISNRRSKEHPSVITGIEE